MKKILFLSFFIILISTFFWINQASAASEVMLDDHLHILQCSGGTDDFYVDIPSSYSGNKISLWTNVNCVSVGINLCSNWGSSCFVNVTPGQRLNFQVDVTCRCTDYYGNQDWDIHADSVTGPICGNGSCESGETCSSCSSDCGQCPGTKAKGETCTFSPECQSGYWCRAAGNTGICCTDGKNCCLIDSDCPTNYKCSNYDCYYSPPALKSNGSSCSSSSECEGYCVHGICRSGTSYCGDDYCDGSESCSSCSSDCGSCAPVKKSNGSSCSEWSECSGGWCVHGACRSSSTYCGDNSCDSGESCSSCSSDCGSCTPALKSNGSSCSSSSECVGYCVHSVCRSGTNYCGDGYCDASEECSFCPADCGTCPTSSGGCTENYQCEKSEYTCARCRSGYRRCDTYQNKCVECKSSSECISGYTCKSYNCERITESAPAPIAPKPEEKKETVPTPSAPKEEKAVCGNKNPEYWLGETCQTCPQDFGLLAGSCCAPGKFFMYPSDYQNKIDKFHETLGGIIPNGTFIVPKQMTAIKSFFADYRPEVCRAGKVAEGECTNNWDCPAGVCSKEFFCMKAVNETFVKVGDDDLAQRLYNKQKNYSAGYSRSYEKIKNDISSCVGDRGLKICLELQGGTVKEKFQEVNKGEPVIAQLKIENIANYSIAVIPEITFPGVTAANINDKMEIKEYDMGLDWSGGIYSVLGNFLTNLEKLMGGKYWVMPAGSKMIVTVKFIPKHTGTLNIQGNVLSTPDAEFADRSAGLIDIVLKPEQYEKQFKKAKVDASVLVKEKPCKWMFCL